MKIATFNINRINTHLAILLAWLEAARPEIVCLQELKAEQRAFPKEAIAAAGYDAVWAGRRSWNGVAILSRIGAPVLTRATLPGNASDEQLIANHRDDWEEDTASDVRVLVGIFRGILEEHDVTHSGEITQEHVAALRQHFNHILPNYGRSPRLRALSPRELREEMRARQ